MYKGNRVGPFDGKTAIVTGAASGIGREIASQLAARGARVLVTDLAGSALDETAEQIDRAGGVVRALIADVRKRADVQAAVDHVVAEYGRLDYMINNAGVAIFGEVEDVSLDDWDRIIDVNLRGVAYGATIAYRQMLRQGHGHIVNTASVAGLVPVPLQTHYSTTKHAIMGMSKTLSLEAAANGIDVTVFCPAFVESGMFDNNTFRGSMAGADARSLVPIKPLPVERAVRSLLRGLARRRHYVVLPLYGRLGWWLERFSPALSRQLHRFTLRETRRRASASQSIRSTSPAWSRARSVSGPVERDRSN